ERGGERVGEQDNGSAYSRAVRATATHPPVEARVGEPGYGPPRVDTGEPLGELRAAGDVRHVRRERGQPRPHREPAQRVVVTRPKPALVVVGQELRLVRRHVDLYRAVVLAA